MTNRATVSWRLPVPLWPNQDEGIWSWIIRLACFYAMPVDDFLDWIGMAGKSKRAAILYGEPSDALVACLSTVSGLPAESIRAMGFRDPCEWKGDAARNGHRYCLHCLKRDRDLGRHDALRRSWSLNRVTFCHIHRSPLVDRCLDCGMPSGAFVYDDGMMRLACGVCRKVVDTTRIPDDDILFAKSLKIPQDEEPTPIARRIMQAVWMFEEAMLGVLTDGIAPGGPFPQTAGQFKSALSYTAQAFDSIGCLEPTLTTVPYFAATTTDGGLAARRACHVLEMSVLTNGTALPALYPGYRSWTGRRARFRAFCNLGGLYHMASGFVRGDLRAYADDLDPTLKRELMLAITSRQAGLGWCGPLEPERPDFLEDCTRRRPSDQGPGTGRTMHEATPHDGLASAGDGPEVRDEGTSARSADDTPPSAARARPPGAVPRPTVRLAGNDTVKRTPTLPEPDTSDDGDQTASHRVEAARVSAVPSPASPPGRASAGGAGLAIPRYDRQALQTIIKAEVRKRPAAFRTVADRRREVQRIARAIVDGTLPAGPDLETTGGGDQA